MSTDPRTPASPGEAGRILLVDDEVTNLHVLRATLTDPNYRLFIARSGEEALTVARRAKPSLVLLDVVMPGIDGYETCRRLKQAPETRDAAVIFLSALNDPKDRVRGFEAGAVDFISKPVQPEEVIARVNTHLTIQRLLRQSAAAVRESEARMSLAVDAADFGIWIRDLARDDVWASEKWRELFGFAPSERLEFNTILERLHPDDRASLQQMHAMAADSPDGSYQTEYRLMLPDGSTRWISSQGRVERDATGRPVRVRSASRDVTSRKQAELLLRDLSGRLIAAQEAERARIARDLHDDVSQQLAGLSIALSGLKRRAGAMPDGEALEIEVSALQQRATAVGDSVRGLSHDLHPDVLRHVGLAAALTAYCKGLPPSAALLVTFDAEGDVDTIGPEAALCLYRIAQEALHNVVKHANARQATVRLLCIGASAELTIADDGRGFDVATRGSGAGIGLVSITERARLLRGTVSIEAAVNAGTKVRVRIPIERPSTTEAGGTSGEAEVST